jgi:multidrug resistance efflux pump
MTDQAIRVDGKLSASRLSWKRLRRLGLYCGLLVCAVGGTVFYMDGGFSGILLRADGYVSRERVAVAPAFEGRIAQVLVRPGDHVEKGQKIAVVKSVAISRTLADLAAEKARLMSKIAELQARRHVIVDTLPLAKSSAAQTATYLNDLSQARSMGLTLNKSVQEMTAASLAASERVASLQAEQASLSVELDADRLALAQAASAYDDLSATYADGALYASVSGDIGASVALAGQALSTGGGGVADIYTGESFVLAYVPDSYLLNVSEGQAVGVSARNAVVNGRIDRILPLSEALPNDLQAPNRMLERGRLVRVALNESNQLPVDQRVQVTTCFQTDCHVGVLQAALERTHTVLDRLFAASTLARSKVQKLVQLGEFSYGALATSFGWVSTK